MRICQVVPCFPYREHNEGKPVEDGYHIGGVERHVLEISRSLANRGHSITVLTTQSPCNRIYNEIDDLEVRRVPYGLSLYSSSIPYNIFRHFNQKDYDIIHAHTPNPTIADLACLKNRGRIPFILTYHNDIIKDGFPGKIIDCIYNKTIGKYLLDNSDIIITTTRSYSESSSRLKQYMSKIRVVPNGVNLSNFSKNINNYYIKSFYNIPFESNVILFIGALEDYKGIDYLIRAFREILDYKKCCYLFIVGSGKQLNMLKNLVEKLEMKDNVVFTGYVKDEDLINYYSMCECFVLPSISKKEGFGIVQLEAMASRKPVICTNLPGVCEVDSEKVASIHIPPRDPRALSDAIIRLLDNKELARIMGERGEKLIRELYTWDKIAEKMEDIYSEVISSWL